MGEAGVTPERVTGLVVPDRGNSLIQACKHSPQAHHYMSGGLVNRAVAE
jgi:hypothetical protein